MSATNYLETKILNHILGNGAYTPPALYAALFTSDPGLESGVVTSEVSGNGYARVAASSFGGYSVATGNSSSNVGHIEFPTATAAWGTITHVGLFDAATGGNLLLPSALVEARDIKAGDAMRINAGSHIITVD